MLGCLLNPLKTSPACQFLAKNFNPSILLKSHIWVWTMSICGVQTINPLVLRTALAHLKEPLSLPTPSVLASAPQHTHTYKTPPSSRQSWVLHAPTSEAAWEHLGILRCGSSLQGRGSWGSMVLSCLTKRRQKGPSLTETGGPAHTHLDGQENHKKAHSASKPLCHLAVCVCMCVCEDMTHTHTKEV